MTRSKEREHLFQWVGPVFKNTTYLYARKEDAIKIKDGQNLNGYLYGTVLNDASEMFLSRLGVNSDQFSKNSKTELNWRMLEQRSFLIRYGIDWI